MKKLTPEDPQTHSADVVTENVGRLRELFPEAFTEGRLDFDVLKQLLSGVLEERDEKYGLNWHGKRRARQLALTPSTGTLRPCPEESVDWATTQNLMIEGDNLEVLKLLQKSYAGKVKLIYIDPPYNTGKDFVYPDNFRDSIRNYLELTGQVDGENGRASSNTETSGRFHTDWLNMMYPRLTLARALLRHDGVIFVSVDDGELHNLLGILNEVFGEENHVATFVWEKKRKASNLDSQVRSITEYVVCFRRSESVPLVASEDVPESNKPYPFYNSGNKRAVLMFPADFVVTRMPNGEYPAARYEDKRTYVDLLDAVTVRDGRVVNPFRAEGEWRYSQAFLDKLVANRERVELKGNKFKPYFINNAARQKFVKTLLNKQTYGIGTNEDGNAEIAEIFEDDVFSFPKPTSLIQKLVEIVQDPDAIVLDFFAGSGTTGQAVLAQNVKDNGGRRFVLVQLPEPLSATVEGQKVGAELCDELGRPRNVAELTKERLRRTAEQAQAASPASAGRFGFRVFKLDHSNIRAWNPSPDDLDEAMFEAIEHLCEGRTEQDVLYELLLKLGLDLCVPIEERKIAGKTVHSIGAGTLFVCLPKKVDATEVEELALGIAGWREELNPAGETTVVFRDSAFADDVAKTNASAILEQHGIENVRSL